MELMVSSWVTYSPNSSPLSLSINFIVSSAQLTRTHCSSEVNETQVTGSVKKE